MNSDMTYLLPGVGLVLLGISLGFVLANILWRSRQAIYRKDVEKRIKDKLSEEDRSERMQLLEEKEKLYGEHATKLEELQDKEEQLGDTENKIFRAKADVKQGREELSVELNKAKQKENNLVQREKRALSREGEITAKIEEYTKKLELLSGISADDAREYLIEKVSGDVKARSAAIIRAERVRAKEESEREGKKIIAMAIQRCAVDEAVQVTTSSVPLPNEGIKSRIIGKEGRNVRTFEAATGVKVVVDDTPETVILSSYDPARREIASRAMVKLIKDGGFTPNKIEDVVGQCQKALEKEMISEGRKALTEIRANRHHPELPHSVGMLKYRTSFGQNLLQHCLEVAHLSGLMAAEVGLDVNLAKRAGLLHDIGKTVSREMEGSHVELGIELGNRFNEHPVVKEAIAEHHEDNERMSAICFLVKAADTISSIRPGGRREDLEGYAQRIMRLEEVANSFTGVRDVYAINAGREIRVMVKGDQVGDDDAEILAFEIADRVKNELTFAGEVKVMVVRETRSVRHVGRNRNGRGPRNSGNGRRGGHRRNGSRDQRKPVTAN
tara:strand:- start:8194 stop:9861 length:1668 start_codon:yes stop_codon:yes gene_type:complete